jgi:hypothetical protein
MFWQVPGPKTDGSTVLQTLKPRFRELTDEIADEVGQMLVKENYDSVHHMYEGSNQIIKPVMDEPYMFSRVLSKIDPVQVLKAIDCYEYQSCEHPQWLESESRVFCQSLRARAINRLPGYDEAAWEVR